MRFRSDDVIAFVLVVMAVQIGCQKHAPTADVIYIHASSDSVLADGSSLDTIYADLPVNTLAAYRGVTFGASSGLFANGFDTMSTVAVRTDVNAGKITAVVILQVSLRGGADTVSATSSAVPQYTDYLMLNLTNAAVDSIQLIPASYVVKDTFGMQDSFTAVLRDSLGGGVSIGGSVVFRDFNLQGGPGGGVFYPAVANVDSNQVATVYFPLLLHGTDSTYGVYLNISAQAYDMNGNQVGRPATKQIYISP